MPFPKQSAIEIPLLVALASKGGAAIPRDLYASIGAQVGLSEEEQQERMDNGAIRWWNAVQWARQKLVVRGEIDGSERGVWKITEAGRRRLSGDTNPALIEVSERPAVTIPVPSADLSLIPHSAIWSTLYMVRLGAA